MKSRRIFSRRLLVEELEPRVVMSVTSTNWAGYAAETNFASPLVGSVSAVSASWAVPTVLNTSGTAYSAYWVGIDGYNSNSVEQIGTSSDIVNGHAQYYAWYEMYPNPVHKIPSIAVAPGDTITASVTSDASNNFTLTIADGAQAPYSITLAASGAKRTSAEWIAEAPSGSFGHILPLANFGTVNFTKASATISGTTGAIDNSNWQNNSIDMVVKRGVFKAVTTPANPFDTTDVNGVTTSAFSVTWKSSGSGGGKGSKAGPDDHSHSNGQLSLDETNLFAPRATPAINPASPSVPLGFNGIDARFNPSSPNPGSPIWMAAGSFRTDAVPDDDDPMNLDFIKPPVDGAQPAPGPRNVAFPTTVHTHMSPAIAQDVPVQPIPDVIAVPTTLDSSEPEAASPATKAVGKIFSFAGAALFFIQGSLFRKSRAYAQKEERERRRQARR